MQTKHTLIYFYERPIKFLGTFLFLLQVRLLKANFLIHETNNGGDIYEEEV